MDLHLLINEYFTLTGRPISTMTVDEYLKFTTAAANTTSLKGTGVQTNNICTPDINIDNTHILNKEENKSISKSNESIANIDKKQSSQSMMSMLRSVNG
jgi:fructose-1,6-bisphosphatase